jgi:putative exporter of polyketide antibiotics
MLASAALVSLGVLPTLATLWWTILIVAAFVIVLLPVYMARTTRRAPEPSATEEP